MQPSLEDIQQAVNKACQVVLEVSKGIHQWGQDRNRIHSAQSSDKDKRPSALYLQGMEEIKRFFFFNLYDVE